jgi:hypothetical protein
LKAAAVDPGYTGIIGRGPSLGVGGCERPALPPAFEREPYMAISPELMALVEELRASLARHEALVTKRLAEDREVLLVSRRLVAESNTALERGQRNSFRPFRKA